MFLEVFGLARDPFLDTADPGFYFETLSAAHARRRLYDCLASGRGLAVVVGAIGAGKTTLFNAAAAELVSSPSHLVGQILDPSFADEAELIAAIADCFGFALEPGRSVREMKESLKRSLFEEARERQAILLVDEAQMLPEALLETLRGLLNFQLDERKLLAIALSGQRELADAILRRPNLSDRVALWIDLAPLRESEAAGLVEHRLRTAGYRGERSPFDEDAMREMWRESGGLPRRLVALAREALEVAAERNATIVTASCVALARTRIVPLAAPRRTQEKAPFVQRWLRRWRRAS